MKKYSNIDESKSYPSNINNKLNKNAIIRILKSEEGSDNENINDLKDNKKQIINFIKTNSNSPRKKIEDK